MTTLMNKKILLDTYNLQLIQGTGIKTYSIGLLKALSALQADIHLLFGVNSGYTKNVDLRQIQFFETLARPSSTNRSYRKKQALYYGLQILFMRGLNSQLIHQKGDDYFCEIQGKIVPENIFKTTSIYNLPSYYSIAKYLFKIFKQELIINPPSPIDIFHSTCPLPIQIKGAKKITTIHDLIPLKLPDITLDQKKYYYELIKKNLKTSDLIIAVSEHTKQDIVKLFNYNPENIIVTHEPLASAPKFRGDLQLTNFLEKFNLKPKDYLLFVGSIEPKKNLTRLLDAYQMLQSPPPLVIVGKWGWLYEDIIKKAEKFPKNQVIFIDYVSKYELQCFYQGAYAFIFPSLYEGFGLPPLEAMSYGCPIITSTLSSLPEVCGESALYVNPYEVDDIADKLQQILDDQHLRNQLAFKAQKQSQLFTLERYSQQLSEAYLRLL